MILLDSLIWEIIKLDKNALINKIKELDPNIKLVQVNKEIDFNNHQILIKEKEVQTINEMLSNLNLKNVDISKVINLHINRLKKLDKEIGKMKNQLIKLESEKINISKENLTTQNILSEKIENIELSKSSIRNYINHFVENIKISYNDNTYSAIQIEFKFFSELIEDRMKYYPELDILDKYVTVFIDKSNTNKIMYFKRTAKYSELNRAIIKQKLTTNSESKIILKKLNQLYPNT
jgi:hypothetical protein